MRSEDETLAGAPLCSLMLTFLSLSTREIALGEVLPGGQGRGKPPSESRAWAAPASLGPSPLPEVPAHQLAGCGRLGWKPQARQHCGAGWRQPPWVGQGAGPGAQTPGAGPSSPRARVLAAPGPHPRGSGLHPVGRQDETWSALQDQGAPESKTPAGQRQEGGQVGISGKRHLRNPLVQPLPHKAGSPRGLEMTPDHKHRETNHRAAQRKEEAGSERQEVTLPWSRGAGIGAGRTNAPGMTKGAPWLSQPGPLCPEALGSSRFLNRAGQVFRSPERKLEGQLKGPGLEQVSQCPAGGSLQNVVLPLPLDLAMAMAFGRCCGGHNQEVQGTHTDAACPGTRRELGEAGEETS